MLGPCTKCTKAIWDSDDDDSLVAGCCINRSPGPEGWPRIKKGDRCGECEFETVDEQFEEVISNAKRTLGRNLYPPVTGSVLQQPQQVFKYGLFSPRTEPLQEGKVIWDRPILSPGEQAYLDSPLPEWMAIGGRYKVKAFKISLVSEACHMPGFWLHDECRKKVLCQCVDKEFFQRFKPEVGDYFVLWANGDKSTVAASSFKRDYNLIE